MPESWPMARHGMPQKQTHRMPMIAVRIAAPAGAGFGPERVGRQPSAAPPEWTKSSSIVVGINDDR